MKLFDIGDVPRTTDCRFVGNEIFDGNERHWDALYFSFEPTLVQGGQQGIRVFGGALQPNVDVFEILAKFH